jgi:hypothetical protein
MFRDSACECGRAFIIETCAIDQCLIFRESKQSWSWIAGLRMIRFEKVKPNLLILSAGLLTRLEINLAGNNERECNANS